MPERNKAKDKTNVYLVCKVTYTYSAHQDLSQEEINCFRASTHHQLLKKQLFETWICLDLILLSKIKFLTWEKNLKSWSINQQYGPLAARWYFHATDTRNKTPYSLKVIVFHVHRKAYTNWSSLALRTEVRMHSFMSFKLTISLTDCIELDAAVSQVLWVEDDFVLRLSVSDKDTNFSGLWTQSYIGFEVVLKDVIQSHSCWTWIQGYIKLLRHLHVVC